MKGEAYMAQEKARWEGKHFAFYTNRECEY